MMRPARTNCSLALEFALVKENILLQDEPITQLYVIQSEQNPFLWFGVLFVDTGIYMGAVIRFNMIIDESYPNCSCPRIIFDPAPYHPLVDPDTGELDTKNAFPDWDSNTHKLNQLVLFVKKVISQAELYIKQIQELISQSQANDSTVQYNGSDNGIRSQASMKTMMGESQKTQVIGQSAQVTETFDPSLIELFMRFEHTYSCIRTYQDDPEEFRRKVDEFKQKCCHRLFDRPISCGDDRNALVFSPWDHDQHGPLRSCVLAGRFKPPSLFASYHKENESVSFVPGSERT